MKNKSLVLAIIISAIYSNPVSAWCMEEPDSSPYKPGVQLMNCKCTWDRVDPNDTMVDYMVDIFTNNMNNSCGDCVSFVSPLIGSWRGKNFSCFPLDNTIMLKSKPKTNKSFDKKR